MNDFPVPAAPTRRRQCIAWLGALALTAAGGPARAQTYPDQPVNIVVPFPAGGASDLAARQVAERLRREWNVPVVVVNKPGAGSAIGSRFVADAKADGHTLLFATSSLITSHYTNEGSPPLAAFAPLAIVATTTPLLLVNAASPHRSLAGFVEAARQPRRLSIGLVPGAYQGISTEQFIAAAGADVLRVPYKGHADASLALAGGHIDAYLAPYAPVRSLLQADRLRALGVAAADRLADLPDVPTLREQGLDFRGENVEAILAPSATPAPVLARIEAALRKIMSDTELIASMRAAGLSPALLDARRSQELLHLQDQELRRTLVRLGMARHGLRD